jgi:cytochrome c551/c552
VLYGDFIFKNLLHKLQIIEYQRVISLINIQKMILKNNKKMKKYIWFCLILWSWSLTAQTVKEQDYYKIITLPIPEGILLEVGGITTLPDGRIALCTRRGEVWMVENPYMKNGSMPVFRLFASGLHEPLGLTYQNNALYTAQRGELTRLADTNGDGIADVYETVYAWPISGHYHEYSYGPKIAPDGSMFVTGNVAFGDQEWWRGESRVPWRGWALRILPNGTMEPWATGMRSPCGLGMINGELFYTDNQGDWMGSGGVWHVKKGSFVGHPAGLRWAQMENSPVKLTNEQFVAKIDERRRKDGNRFIKPENIANETNPHLLYKAKEDFPSIQTPAVWLPHGILGISNSEILEIPQNNPFGAFAGQLLVGDQGQSKIMRVAMEKINGEYQGVAFDFVSGFQSGVLRMSWGKDGSLFLGETNRGWGSAGDRDSGLERLVWLGEIPFEMKTVKAMPDGFEIEFTKPVNRKVAEDLDTYAGQSFIYKYHPVYGSPPINNEPLKYKGVKVSADGLKVRLVLDNLRQYYVHELNLTKIRAEKDNLPLLHSTGFYTLNNIPTGEKLKANEISTFRSSVKKVVNNAPTAQNTTKPTLPNDAPTYAQIQPLLNKHTCSACHQVDKKQVGPSFKAIAQRKYTPQQIVNLIYNPQPQNWPDYATEMAPMPQVPKEDALKIAKWINTLK